MTILSVKRLAMRRGERLVVNDVSFAVARGERVAIMGASGAGKTTILRGIAELDPVAEGEIEIEIDGQRVASGPQRRLTPSQRSVCRVGMVFQFHHLFEHLTAAENVWLAPVHVLGLPRAEAEDRARALLDLLGVGERAGSLPHELSGGEAQRVAIARALAMDPPVLLMDEPTASLDVSRRGELAGVVRDLAAAGRAVVIATHDVEFARACVHRVLVLDGGRVVREGPATEVLSGLVEG